MKCMMIGYSKEKMGYHLLSNENYIITQDVIFDEIESRSAVKINNLLQNLEKKLHREKNGIHK